MITETSLSPRQVMWAAIRSGRVMFAELSKSYALRRISDDYLVSWDELEEHNWVVKPVRIDFVQKAEGNEDV